jgi:glycosyltransferase involved in cell wall biosynthesis
VSKTAVHQLVPSVVPGDATTAHTLAVQQLLRDLGYHSEIYATAVHEQLEDKVHLMHELRGPESRKRYLIYQLSSQSPLADMLIGRLEQVAVNYHNITPSHFLRGWDKEKMLALRSGEVQVAQLARIAGVGICDSAFNAEDLKVKGWSATKVVPILLDLAEFEAEPDEATAKKIERRPKGGRWLFVGALAPHKAQHLVLRAFACYRREFDPDATISLVGRPVVPSYAQALESYVLSLGLAGAVDLTGGVSHQQLVAYYEGSDVLVSASQHEGFCVPLLEAMYHGLPIVASSSGAVPQTIEDAGMLLDGADPADIAATVARVLEDGKLRSALEAAGRRRLEHFSLERTRNRMREVIEQWVA